MITLEDLKGLTELEVLKHLATEYAGDKSGFDYGEIKQEDIYVSNEKLKNMEVLIAYESVGSWGCDSSSFFLLRNKKTGKLFEIHGSHCSCYGFEGQLDLEETDIVTLKERNKKGVFYTGGYDENEDENQKIVKEFIESL
jgi:hypothetical protein